MLEVNKKNFQGIEIKPSTEEGFNLDTAFIQEKFENRDEKLDYYFESYSHFGIHEEMLKDEIRTMSYMRSIVKNKHLFKDKIVLDVGSGTGVLSMFAAKAGAKHVYAVDLANIVEKSKLIVEENEMSDKVTVIRGKIEEIVLPVDKIDIIISEWMGYCLLYEGMLDSVLYARDKWLVPGGLIFPDKAVMFIASIEDEQFINDKIDYWNKVYGFSMNCMESLVDREPLVDVLDGKAVNSNPCAVFEIDIETIKVEELNFVNKFSLKINRDDIVNGFVSWFECFFTHCHTPERLDTGPFVKSTHWKQTMFYIERSLTVRKNQKIDGHFAIRKNKKNPREIEVKLAVHHFDTQSKQHINQTRTYNMR